MCIGYSNLLCDMCSAVGIPCESIVGFSKHSAESIGKTMKKPDHSWNAIKLQGTWKLCDVTWSAGFYDERSGKMIKRFSDTYFLMPPSKFIYTHLPKKKTWQLLDTVYAKSTFEKLPFVYPGFFVYGLKHFPTAKGILKLKAKDSLILRLESTALVDSVHMELTGIVQRFASVLQKTGANTYTVRQKFDIPGDYILIVYMNHRAILGYRMKVQE